VPLLLGKHDKNIISCADIEETGFLSRSVRDFAIPDLMTDNVAQATTYTFAGGKGMVVIERHGKTIANFNFTVLPTLHQLAQAFMPQHKKVAQIVSALVDEDFRGTGISRLCYSMLSRRYIVCSDEQQTLEGAALWYFKISEIDHITMHIVYRYDQPDYTIDKWAEQDAWSGESTLVNFAIDGGIPATHDDDHSKTVFVAVSAPYANPNKIN
jgi:hypothetical protein